LKRLEARSGGRLGVAVVDTGAKREIQYRYEERFPMCSTFKLLAVGAVLTRVDQGKDRLDRNVRFLKTDLVGYSPVTEKHAGGEGMTLKMLCEAAMTQSDNTAANLILASLGGPSGVTQFARTLGDDKTRLDRIEPELNECVPGDPRDTSTPVAMLRDLQKLALGGVLSPASKHQLTEWLVANQTGDARLRAGLPVRWRVGDKTGTGRRGTANDVAITCPPNRVPILISVYLTGSSLDGDERDQLIAAVGHLVGAWSGANGQTR
jgi:beta-lactamase class A